MSENLFYVITNLFFAAANGYYMLYGVIPRFSALCFGINLGAAIYIFNNYLAVG